MLKNINPTELKAWKKLQKNFDNDKRTLKTRFFEDPDRFNTTSSGTAFYSTFLKTTSVPKPLVYLKNS